MEVLIKELQNTGYKLFYLASRPDILYNLVGFNNGYYMSLATNGPFVGETVRLPPEIEVITVDR